MKTDFNETFSDDVLIQLVPADRANEFFDALYGDVEEGVYDITLAFNGHNSSENALEFA